MRALTDRWNMALHIWSTVARRVCTTGHCPIRYNAVHIINSNIIMRPALWGGLVKHCTLSVCLSVCPARAYTTSESGRNFTFRGDTSEWVSEWVAVDVCTFYQRTARHVAVLFIPCTCFMSREICPSATLLSWRLAVNFGLISTV